MLVRDCVSSCENDPEVVGNKVELTKCCAGSLCNADSSSKTTIKPNPITEGSIIN